MTRKTIEASEIESSCECGDDAECEHGWFVTIRGHTFRIRMDRSGRPMAGVTVNWEDENELCAHCGKLLECAYPSD